MSFGEQYPGLEDHSHLSSGDGGYDIDPIINNGSVMSWAFNTVYDAIEYAYNNGYAEVQVPPGVRDNWLQVVYPIRVTGMGPANPYYGGSEPVAAFDGGGDTGIIISADGAEVRNLVGICNDDVSGAAVSSFAVSGNNVTVENCYAVGADFAGFTTSVSGGGTGNNVRFRNCGGDITNPGGDDVLVDTNSNDCTVDVDPDLSVTDNGTNTKVV